MAAPLAARRRVREAELAIEAQVILGDAVRVLHELAGLIDIGAPTVAARAERNREADGEWGLQDLGSDGSR